MTLHPEGLGVNEVIRAMYGPKRQAVIIPTDAK